MTKGEYIDFVRNSLQMVDKTAKFHRQQVAAAINNAVNTLFWEMYEKNPRQFVKSMERYTTLVSNTPVNDVAPGSTLTRFVSTLTVDLVDLPRKSGGVYEITANANYSLKFIPVTTMEGEQIYGAESTLNGAEIGFAMTGPRYIEYWEMSSAEATAGVVIRAIKQFKSYSSTDNVLLPYGQDERIIELVREYLSGIPPKDLVNDNADANG